MTLPFGLTLEMMQTKWRSILNPLLANPTNNSSLLRGISLINGTTTINHLLGETLQGWKVVGIDGAATIYDQQANNPRPELTLVLVSNAAVQVTLEVF